MNPLSLLSGPYGLLIKLGLVVAVAGFLYAAGYTNGNKRATDACSAEKLAAVQKYQAEYQKAVVRGAVLAKKVSALESESANRSKEAMKNVPQVTTGKSCLNSAAVRMLNHRGNDNALPEAPGKPAAKSTPDAPATDTDTAYWIADAIAQYEVAAARLNALVDYFEKE